MKINEVSVMEAARGEERRTDDDETRQAGRQASLNLKLLWKVMGMMYRARPGGPSKAEWFEGLSWGGGARKYGGALYSRCVMRRFPA